MRLMCRIGWHSWTQLPVNPYAGWDEHLYRLPSHKCIHCGVQK